MRTTGATRGRINCGRTILFTINKSNNTTNYKRPQWSDVKKTALKTTIYTIICLKSVGVRRLQVTILARSPREMSLTDRIHPRYILTRVRVSVRPRIFLYAKNPKPDSPAVGSALRPDKQLNWKLQNRPS